MKPHENNQLFSYVGTEIIQKRRAIQNMQTFCPFSEAIIRRNVFGMNLKSKML